ncbi:MAG: histidine kinase [Propionibacteriaceae bacterium]|nr:histidine kinase [Propionibacteriaceae bacterium]
MTRSQLSEPPATTWRRVWGEAWRFGVSLLGGTLIFGMRVDISQQAALIPAESEPIGSFTVTAAPVTDLWLAVDFVVGVVVLLALFLRRRWPLPVAAFAVAATAVTSFGVVAAMVCVVSIATRRRIRDLWVLAPLILLAVGVNLGLAPLPGTSRLEQAMTFGSTLVLFAAAWAWGAYRGARRDLVASLRERAATLESEQSLRVAQARTAERSRIAQEMHDVLAHRISLIAVHANALSFRSDLPPAQVAEHAGVIRDNADRAVAELAGVLGVLRGGEGDATAAPQPTLEQLPALLEDAQRSGTRVAAIGAMPDFDDLPLATSRSAFRIIQECLTNARKHATGLPVTLQITGTEGVDLDIVVSNPLPGTDAEAGAPILGTGMGLLGLAERVELAGGTMSHAVEDGFFVVRAHLPWSN